MLRVKIRCTRILGLFCIFYTARFLTRGNEINVCTSKEKCGDCIAEDPRCAWCLQENFTELDIPRCNYVNELQKICQVKNIVIPKEVKKVIKNLELSDKGAIESEAIQIKPQEIYIKLRPNSVQKFSLKFRQALDYPVDLYYLMDLSNSMKDDKDNLARLGDDLAEKMKEITRNFRLGFGSFVDKKVAPFVVSHPDKLKEPCPGCAAPYGFHNSMPLNSRTKDFAKKVMDTPGSGNLDAPEGGFDAIMQAILCHEEIGWRNKSRKLLVFSTDSGFHYAGDGKMGGIVAPNDEKCHLDNQRNYYMSTKQDYPSLGQLNRQIRKHNMNIIFAVTQDQVPLYEMLSERLSGCFTGRLESDSSNVVGLIRDQYNKITSSVEMSDNVQDSNILLSYYSKCLGKNLKKTNICSGLKTGTTVEFEVHVEFGFCPADSSTWNRTFYIFPIGLNDHLKVNLEMICDCDCQKAWEKEINSPKCTNGNGTFECGICNCNEQRYGKECECDINDMDPFRKDSDCYNGDDEVICSGQGICHCGKCYCNPPEKKGQKIYGTYCECTNLSCDKKNGKFCNDHGNCDCGICKCHFGWTGEDCGCRDSNDTCTGPDGKICSDHGKCECGFCHCNSDEQEYFGPYCDDCSTCPGMCDELHNCVVCWLKHQREDSTETNCTLCSHSIYPVDVIEVDNKEKLCLFVDENSCRFSFKYAFDDENQLKIYSKTVKECPPPVNVLAIVSWVSGSVVGIGIFLLLLWKLLTTIHDRRELAKFEKEKLKATWQRDENPIYKQATSTFQNPAYGED